MSAKGPCEAECALEVALAFLTLQPLLRRGRSLAQQQLTGGRYPELATHRLGQLVGLIEATLPQAFRMQWYGDHQVGVIRAVVDDLDGAVVTVARSRAVRRARLVRPDADPVGVAGDLFGVWWVDAGALGLRAFGETAVPTDDSGAPVPGDDDLDASGWASRLYDAIVAFLRRLTR